MQRPRPRFYIWGLSAGEKRPKPEKIFHVFSFLCFQYERFYLCVFFICVINVKSFTWRPSLTTVCQSNIQTWGSVGHGHFPKSRRPVENFLFDFHVSFFKKNFFKTLRPDLRGLLCNCHAELRSGQSQEQSLPFTNNIWSYLIIFKINIWIFDQILQYSQVKNNQTQIITIFYDIWSNFQN